MDKALLDMSKQELQEALVKALADTRRLDWLEANMLTRKGAFLWRNSSPPFKGKVTMIHGHFDSVRAAIDAAQEVGLHAED